LSLEERVNYYLNMKRELLKDFDKISKGIGGKVLEQRFDESTTPQLIMSARNEYESLIPQLPYIGGKSNILYSGLIGSAWMLAIIRSLEKKGLSVHDIGEIIYNLYEAWFESMPRIKKWFAGKMYSSIFMRRIGRKQAQKSQLRTYPDDWVFEYVEGDGETFDYGFDYTECGICKLYKEQDAEKYLPFICLGDYPMYRSFGVGMKRTQTIGNGAESCDFRFKRNETTNMGWPPEGLEEFKGNKNK